MRGLILFAHGARDPRWSAPFEAVAQSVRAQCPERLTRNAYLEFMTPDLVSAGRELAQAGCLSVDVLPLFLGVGGHVRNDVPKLIEQLRAEWPAVHWQLHAAVGEHTAVIEAMAGVAAHLHTTAALSREDQR